MRQYQHNPFSRVLPRDAFNEAKLLKGIGFLTLKIHNGLVPDGLTFSGPEENTPFEIVQDPASGDLYVANVTIRIHGDEIDVFHSYNDREGLTLRFEYQYPYEEVYGFVFDGDDPETFSEAFLRFCNNHPQS